MQTVDLSKFENPIFDRGGGRSKEALWLAVRQLLFQSSFKNYRLKASLLRSLGATLGTAFVCKPRVQITFPWRLRAGNNCWIGEEAYILNLDHVTLGNNVCISQRAFLCTGSHDTTDPHFGLIHQPITIEDGAWICANAFIGPGVTIGRNTIVSAGSVVTKDLPPDMICGGQPCVPIKPRVLRDAP